MRKWLIAGLTVAWLAWELVAAFDGSDATWPLTQWLIQLPWWVLAPAALTLSIWLPIHLWVSKKRRTRARESVRDQATPAAQERPGV